LWQLAHTIPQNVAAIEKDGCAEMVLVNYNSQDGLEEWVRQFRPAIEAGTLRDLHQPSDLPFHASNAQHFAPFSATGEFVVNLDADNFIGNMIARCRRFWADTLIPSFTSSPEFGPMEAMAASDWPSAIL